MREVTDHEDFAGRAEASMRVDLRARVAGYLAATRFKDGDLVKKGDLLFEIDPRPYQADLNQALSQVDLTKATLGLARAALARDQALAKAAPGSVSAQQLQQDQAAVDEALARVKAAEASVERSKLYLDFCKVTAPISGRIGASQIDPGNLVSPDQTLLAVLVSEEPIYVYLDIDERTYLRLRRAMPERNGEVRKLPVAVALTGEKDFAHHGVLEFTANRVDPDTGTIRLRATLANKDRRLLPGMFARVRLALGAPYKALLVRDQAIGTDQGRKFVYVVDQENKVQVRWIEIGASQSDGLRVITEGLKPDDHVVIGQLARLRPGMTVRPRDADMLAPKAAPPPEEASCAFGPAASGIRVEATYPGANAEIVADAVRLPIEQQVNGLENVRYLRSRCTSDGKYGLDVAFASGVDPWRSQVLVQNRVALALPQLPAAVSEAGVNVRRGTAGVLLIATLTASDGEHNRHFLSNYASIQLRDDLARRSGVGEVALVGRSEYGLQIRLDTDRLAALNLNLGDVVQALRKEKWDRGEADEKVTDLILKANGEGGVVRLRDVANLQFGAIGPRSEAFQDTKPAVALVVYLSGDVAPRKVSATLQERLRDLRARLPRGLLIEVNFDFTASLETPAKSADADYVLLDLDFTAASAGSTSDVLQRSATLLRQLPAVKRVLALSENPFDVFGGHPCLLVQLSRAEQGKTERAEVLRALRNKLGALEDVIVRLRDFSTPGCWPRGGYPIDLALRGPDAAEVREWASKLADRLRQSKQLTDVWVNSDSLPRPTRFVDINRQGAAARGVALADIFSTIEVNSGALPVTHFNRFGRLVRVEVQADARSGDWADGLVRLKVRNAKGQMIALGNFVTVREVERPRALDFLDFHPMVQLTANVEPGVSVAAGQKLCTLLADEVRRELGLTPEYRLTWLQATAPGQ
jgi:RND family efflux transporter MFP subunit